MNKLIDMITNKIPLPLEYHNFADQRSFLGIPNTMNVISNIAILIPAIYLLQIRKNKSTISNLLILHLVLLSVASSYYHWNPSDETIFWDILMIAVTIMLVTIIISDTEYGIILYGLGIMSILYWRYTGDLRLYILILIGVPLYIVFKYHKNSELRNYLIVFVIANILLRLTEHNDHLVYQITGNQISGHTLKHVFAGIMMMSVIKILQKVNKI